MKKLYITFLALISSATFSQTTIFSENFGSPSGTTTINSNNYQNGSPITFSGTAEIRITTPSDNYAGASGNGCVFIGATLPTKTFQIEGINTLNHTNLTLSFGQYKGLDAASNEMTVEVSEDGTTWTQPTYTRSSGPGTSVWTMITATGTIPSTANLRIRFTNPTNSTTALSVGYRIDDIKLTGTPEVLNNDNNTITGLKIYPNPAKNTLFVTSDSFVEKQVELYNVLGKIALKANTSNAPINLSGLASGIYIVKVTEERKTATRKLVIE
jgi:hypothetical protein